MGNMSTKNMRLTPAVVLSSHTIGLAVIRGLGSMGVPIIAVSYQRDADMGYSSKYVIEKIFSPHPERDEESFIKLLIEYAKNKHQKFHLIPADDATLITVSKNKNKLNEYYITQCTDWEITQQFLDKKYTYFLAEKIGVPAPKTFFIKNINEIERFAEIVGFPCIIKPCYSHRYFERFRKKMVKVNNLHDLKEEFLKADRSGIEVMIQELIEGDDTLGVNYNSVFINGEPMVEFVAEKVRLSPPSFGVPCVVKSCDYIPDVVESGRKFLKAMNFNGYSCTEFKKDLKDNRYKLMEVNGRHNRSGLLSIKCGINFPWIMYGYYNGQKVNHVNSYRKNIYWIDEFKDTVTTGKRILSGKYSIIDFLKPYFRRHIFAIFDWRDINPFIRRIINAFKMFKLKS